MMGELPHRQIQAGRVVLWKLEKSQIEKVHGPQYVVTLIRAPVHTTARGEPVVGRR